MIQEIKRVINITEVAREAGYTPNKYDFIKSIYKEEATPSLKLYPGTNSYYCFATGKGGDVIKFYQDIKRVDFKTAIAELAKRYGVDGNIGKTTIDTGIVHYKFNLTESEKECFEERAGIYQFDFEMSKENANQATMQQIYSERLEMQKLIYKEMSIYCGELNPKATQYLTGPKRGLTEEKIKDFGLFCINDVAKTERYLRENFNKDHLTIAGLLNEKGNFVFSMNTLIIPYYEGGEIVYLRARTLSASDSFKYIGLYNYTGDLTAKRVFNLDILKNLKKGSSLLICEGEFDRMIAVQNGYNAIGIPGVNNAPTNIKTLIKEFDITIAFDNDEPGKKGMQVVTDMIGKKIQP